MGEQLVRFTAKVADFEVNTIFNLAYVDVESCGCTVPCYQIKYSAEVSHSKFPDPGTAHVLTDYYGEAEYIR